MLSVLGRPRLDGDADPTVRAAGRHHLCGRSGPGDPSPPTEGELTAGDARHHFTAPRSARPSQPTYAALVRGHPPAVKEVTRSCQSFTS
jgi:hypothetical protein